VQLRAVCPTRGHAEPILADLRFGVNNIFVGRTERIFPVSDKILVGYSGLITDCQTLSVLFDHALL